MRRKLSHRAELQGALALDNFPLPVPVVVLFGDASVYLGLRFGGKWSDPVAALGLQLESQLLEDLLWRLPFRERLRG